MSQIFHTTVLHHLLNTVGDSMSSFLSVDQSHWEKLKETDDLKLNVENLSEVDRNEKQMLESLSFLPVSLSFLLHSFFWLQIQSQTVLFNIHLDENIMSGH